MTTKNIRIDRIYGWRPKVLKTLVDVQEGRLSYSSDQPIVVTHLDSIRGGFYIVDGNHRVVEAALRGDPTIAAVLDPHVPYIERTGGAYRSWTDDMLRPVDVVSSRDASRDPASRKHAPALRMARHHRYSPALGDIVVHPEFGPGLIRLTRGPQAFVIFAPGTRPVPLRELEFVTRPAYRCLMPNVLPSAPLERRQELLTLRRRYLLPVIEGIGDTHARQAPPPAPPSAPRVRVAAKKKPAKKRSAKKPDPVVTPVTPVQKPTPRSMVKKTRTMAKETPAKIREARQVKINAALAREAQLDREEWLTKPPDRSGASAYVVMIRSSADPERRQGGRESGDIAPHLTLKKTKPEAWATPILKLLSDGKPRTLNRIGVELIDKTADITAFTPFVWLLVERGDVEYTPQAPVYFRATKPAKKKKRAG